MTTTEHLQKIKSKCEQLLAIAEKRTPGKWEFDGSKTLEHGTYIPECSCLTGGAFACVNDNAENRGNDADFITACAGPAEAGWRSTIAAIDQILSARQDTICWEFIVKPMMDNILAAWPEDLL